MYIYMCVCVCVCVCVFPRLYSKSNNVLNDHMTFHECNIQAKQISTSLVMLVASAGHDAGGLGI